MTATTLKVQELLPQRHNLARGAVNIPFNSQNNKGAAISVSSLIFASSVWFGIVRRGELGAGEEPMSSSVLATLQRENPPEQDFPRVQTSAQHSERTRLTTETSGKKKPTQFLTLCCCWMLQRLEKLAKN